MRTAMTIVAAALALAACSEKKTTGDADAGEMDADGDEGGDGETDPDAGEMDVPGDDGPDTDDADDADAADAVEGACGHQPGLADCTSTDPAPATTEEIHAFVGDNAIPLECRDGDEWVWEFDIYADEVADARVFMFGEIHGSVELGDASADLFEYLARAGLVDTLAMEIAWDTTDALGEYVETGEGDLVTTYGYGSWPQHRFWRTLVDRARALHEDGITIAVHGVDTPWRLAWVNEQIEDMAAGLDPASAAILTDTLPAPLEYGAWVEETYVGEAEAYRQTVLDNLPGICPELTDAECERLEFLARGLWLGAFSNSILFYTSPPAEVDAWFAERELLIDHVYRTFLLTGEERVYAHMGAAHTAKWDENVAGMLDEGHPPVAGRVYTTTPAYGTGSRIQYGFWIQDLDPEPLLVSAVLESVDPDAWFLATHHPGLACDDNPFVGEVITDLGADYGGDYDSMFWVRRLTPDTTGTFVPWEPDPMRAIIQDKLTRMQSADRIPYGDATPPTMFSY